jgi:hypothetical protein
LRGCKVGTANERDLSSNSDDLGWHILIYTYIHTYINMYIRLEMTSWGTIHILNFINIGTGIQEVSRFGLSNFRGCNDGITDMGSGGMIYIPRFMTIGSDIQVIVRLLPQHFQSVQGWYY